SWTDLRAGAEAVGSTSHGQFGLVVQALYHAAGELLLGAEVVQDQRAVRAWRPGDLLHRHDAGAHDLIAPLTKELASATRRLVVPELLEVLLEQIGPHGLQVVAQQIAQAEPLMLGQVGLALEHAPTGLLQHRLVAVAGQPASLGGTHLVQRGIHLGNNMEAIEDVDGLAAPLADHLQIGLPHVRAHKLDLSGQLFADQGEELLEALHRPLPTDPEQAGALLLDLVDQRQVFVTLGILDLIDADRLDRAQLPVLEPPLHDILDRLADFVPGAAKRRGGFLPGELPRPVRQEQHVGLGQLVFADTPRDRFDAHPATPAIDPSHAVEEHHHAAPKR